MEMSFYSEILQHPLELNNNKMISKNLSENEIPSPGGKNLMWQNVFLSLSICVQAANKCLGQGWIETQRGWTQKFHERPDSTAFHLTSKCFLLSYNDDLHKQSCLLTGWRRVRPFSSCWLRTKLPWSRDPIWVNFLTQHSVPLTFKCN